MRLTIEVELDYWLSNGPADVLLQVEAAAMADQRIEHEALTVWSDTPIAAVKGEDGIGQRCWIRGEGQVRASYRATVAITREPVQLEALAATPVRMLAG